MQRILTQFKRKTAPLRRWIRHRSRRPYSDSCNPADSIVLASCGRSGSTWLAGLLNWDNEYRYLFEPMHHDWVDEFTRQPRYSYLPSRGSSAAYESLQQSVTDAFSGRLSNPWIDQFNPQRRPARRLVKTIRGNLALPGFVQACPDTPVIFLIRNPMAQALSVVRGGWNLNPEWLSDQTEFSRHYPELCRYLNSISTDPFQKAIVFWCIENFIPINELDRPSVQFTHYEEIVSAPATELQDLFRFIGKPFDERVLEKVQIPSKTSRRSDKNDPLTRWRSQLTALQQKQAQRTIADFGLSGLYTEQGTRGASVAQVRQDIQNSPLARRAVLPPVAGATT